MTRKGEGPGQRTHTHSPTRTRTHIHSLTHTHTHTTASTHSNTSHFKCTLTHLGAIGTCDAQGRRAWARPPALLLTAEKSCWACWPVWGAEGPLLARHPTQEKGGASVCVYVCVCQAQGPLLARHPTQEKGVQVCVCVCVCVCLGC